MPDPMYFFDLTTGTTTTLTYEARQQHLIRCEAALRRIWEVTGCFPSEATEPLLVGCHEIAHAALYPDAADG